MPRIDLGGGLDSPSDDGGFELFAEFFPICARNSANSARNNSTITLSWAFSAANSSYDGCDSADTTP